MDIKTQVVRMAYLDYLWVKVITSRLLQFAQRVSGIGWRGGTRLEQAPQLIELVLLALQLLLQAAHLLRLSGNAEWRRLGSVRLGRTS